MPHATGPQDARNDEEDGILIGRVLNPGHPLDIEGGLDLQRDLEPGEKADDAVDFGDLSDDDLAEDEDVAGGPTLNRYGSSSDSFKAFVEDQDLPALTNGDDPEDDGMDDLFGDKPSVFLDPDGRPRRFEVGLSDPDVIFDKDKELLQHGTSTWPPPPPSGSRHESPLHRALLDFKDTPLSREQQLQMELFEMSRPGQDTLPAPPENQEELLASLWPKFKRNIIPKFIDLLPPKRARYVGKVTPKPPRPVNPTKIALDLAQDQEKIFKAWPVSGRGSSNDTVHSSNFIIEHETISEKAHEEYMELGSDFESDAVGGVSWQDLQVACEDWDTSCGVDSLSPEQTDHYRFKQAEKDGCQDRDHGEKPSEDSPPAKVSGKKMRCWIMLTHDAETEVGPFIS